MKAITEFRGQYRFLSNFYIEPDGTHVEGEYQAAKCMCAADRNLFVGLSPSAAKRLGRKIKLRADWEESKLAVMYELVERKFWQHSKLVKLLLDTGDAELVEGNWWGDEFWGVCNNRGQNHLGKILMRVRGERYRETSICPLGLI